MMKTKISNLTKTVALLSSGALLGVFLLAPISAGASHVDEDETLLIRGQEPTTFVLKATNGLNFNFQLQDDGNGAMEFIHTPPTPRVVRDFGEDD